LIPSRSNSMEGRRRSDNKLNDILYLLGWAMLVCKGES